MNDALTVIYNDTCPICAREVAGYRRATRRAGLPVAYAGLSEGAAERFGLSADQAARRFHVARGGRLHDGVDAFALLWERMPRLRWLAWLVRRPGLHWLSRQVYDGVLAPVLYALHRRRVRQGCARRIG